jgi:hypothetical protein
MKQVNGNPTNNFNITTTTYSVTSTGASGTLNANSIGNLERGSSFIIDLNSGSAQGFTDLSEYFVIPVNANSIRIAATKADAFDGNYISGASGNAGAATVYPNYKVGGILVINTAGNVYVRGLGNNDTGFSSFSLQTTVADGSVLPFMIKDLCASGLTAGGLVCWSN